jgi:hypothetical protein
MLYWLQEALNKFPQRRGARIGMGCKADFAANIWILARNSTPQTARVRVIARCEGLIQRFLQPLPGKHVLQRSI